MSVPPFLKKNWIYLSETLLGPTRHLFDGQKRQKKAEGFWFGVNFIHFCLSVFLVTLFLENHSIFSHEILYSCSFYWCSIHSNNPPGLLGANYGYGGQFWHMYLFFLISVQYFLMKLCTGVLGITLMVTTLKTNFTSWLSSAGGHLGVFWDLFLHMYIFFLDIRLILRHEISHRCSWYNPDYH